MANILITTKMLTELDLQGSDLLVYALINGFSKDGQGCFYGTREYIAQTLNMSVPTVARVLKKLTDQGLLRKGSVVHNGLTKPTYAVTVGSNNQKPIEVSDTSTKKETTNKAIPASVEEVAAYCREKGFTISAEAFFSYHSASGWMIGKNKMKDWKAAVRYWAANESKTKKQNYYDRRNNDIETPVIATSADDYRESFAEAIRKKHLGLS